ncbi:NTP transferase domain-containing protein [Vibrio syngnathi]|uniref:2-C-methyl-D-erythritol 4-phosphate cytidylyltransferase n=1 Tax=Vibrio syngnathi TaxID=3034029 RepID=A0AA34TR35_9VIBR|nr:sugar phosphate nucleotidyltransferase [Vibrio syngnathi]ARP39450.1 2-C-methyl-D-erythritol 4-phosphate cytidylyltransferase [Vibrio syngnathi]
MQVVIPMSGIGKRFIDAGYDIPKPLIVIDGKPIIQHVVELFPGESNFVFICNEDHIQNTNMKSILEKIAPTGKIVTIPKHKLGPVYAVQQVYDLINDQEEVIVNYCDFGTYWDYQGFLKHTRNRKADGAVPAYKGFHPHMLGSTNYAFMRDDNQWMLEIQEKKPFTDNRMEEFASNGTYYFRTGELLKTYFDAILKSGDDLNGEYYVSVVYNKLVEAGLKVSIYEIQHMLQWGTPQDVDEYLGWSNYFKTNQDFLARKRDTPLVDNVVLPMAGAGSRFVKEGYKIPKPLISVNGKPMVANAIYALPNSNNISIGVLAEHENKFAVKDSIVIENTNVESVIIPTLTSGQATTCAEIIKMLPNNQSFVIGACDNGMVWDEDHFKKLIDEDVDVLLWAFKGHPHAVENPEQYGWIEVEGDDVVNVSVKKPISDIPKDDWGIVGAFYFKNRKVFEDAYNRMVEADCSVNGEYYADSLANFLDKNIYQVKIIPVEHFICWGTPNDYNTYNYWQSFFHKSDSHPYKIDNDKSVAENNKIQLINKCFSFEQDYI